MSEEALAESAATSAAVAAEVGASKDTKADTKADGGDKPAAAEASVPAVQGSRPRIHQAERQPWRAVSACRGLSAPVISSGPSKPAKRIRCSTGRSSLYARIQRTSSRLGALGPHG
ncbi:hypothetical protein STENM223S_00870 [Streptomyces tendae]